MGHIRLLTRITLLSLSPLAAEAFERPLFRRKRHAIVKPGQQNGVTLGDLDAIEQSSNDRYDPNFNNFVEPNWGCHTPQHSSQLQDDSSSDEQVHSKKSTRNLRRISLDLSGRIMCHMFSPEAISSNAAVEEPTSPLFYLPSQWKKTQGTRNFSRFLPRVYIGANYDLDEIWYGATRWIAKCSWGPSTPKDEINLKNGSLLTNSFGRKFRNLAAIKTSMASFTSSKWHLDLEGEQSVFDPADTTVRVALTRTPNDPCSNEIPRKLKRALQKLTLEYDSSKYFPQYRVNTDHVRRNLQFSPLVSLNFQTPFLHPRLEFHSKHRWIINEGGDRKGNYYGGEYYGSDSPASRRLQQIKANFRENTPQSKPKSITVEERESSTSSSSIRYLFGRISSWLENDGWMPRTITTDLLGNLVAINDIGFGDPLSETPKQFVLRNSDRDRDLFKSLPRRNMGLRLRISKKLDWSKLGIFPWSNNSYESILRERRRDDKKSMRIRVELCGLNEAEDRRAWVAIDADPFDAIKTFKVVVGQESASLV